MSDAIGLIGFYFTLIGFISGLFFTRLDGWYGSVRVFRAKVEQLSDRDDFLAARVEEKGLGASAPTGSFVAIGILLAALMVLSFFIPVGADPPVDPALFIRGPIVLTVLFYVIGGTVLLARSKSLLREAEGKINTGISG